MKLNFLLLNLGIILLVPKTSITAKNTGEVAKKVETPALTIPKKNYTDSIDFSNAPKRHTKKYPLSDQKNKGKWILNKKASDEFKGRELNTERWLPNNPSWKGRQPTYFTKENTTVEHGKLVMRINQGIKNQKLPEGFTHTSGFIVSKDYFLYGYFEARLKPNDSPWVTGFWMSNGTRDWWTEIDICENAPGIVKNRHDLNSNVHVFKSPVDQGNVKKHFSRGARYYVPFELQKDYHTWGLDWQKDTIRFYIDGVLFRTIENTHWHQPLRININNESNKWFGALPDNNRLSSKYYVDYVRIWNK